MSDEVLVRAPSSQELEHMGLLNRAILAQLEVNLVRWEAAAAGNTPVPFKEIALVLTSYGWLDEHPMRAGSFVSKLIDAIAAADVSNRALLARGYPDLVIAVDIVEKLPDGANRLRKLVLDWMGWVS